MRSPLEASVQALRGTRLVEGICAWTIAHSQFFHTTLKRRRDTGKLVVSPKNGAVAFESGLLKRSIAGLRHVASGR